MRFSTILLAILLASSSSIGQISDRLISQKFYAGALYTGSVPRGSYALVNAIDVRAATEVIVGSDDLKMTGRFAWSNPNTSIGHFWLTKPINDFDEIRAGFVSRPIALLMRSGIHTADFHFEPSAKSAIPGSSLGLVWADMIDQKVNLAGGISRSAGNHIEINFGGQIDPLIPDLIFGGGRIDLAAFWSVDRTGLAAKVAKSGNFECVVFSDNDSTASLFFLLNTPIGDPYLSYVGDLESIDDYQSLEIGLTRDFNGGMASGLAGIGYDWAAKAIRFYIFVHN
ncbi:MAG: hypothetical protein Q8L36_00040 [bacterium]|nr:hypothetical protein [bacterium]